MRVDRLRLDHPEFERCHRGSHLDSRHILFIFNRPMFHEPTAKQLADYDRRENIVRANGGMMIGRRSEIGGNRRPFTKPEVEAIKRLVARTHKGLRVVMHWNSAGCYSLTVATMDRATASDSRKDSNG